MREKAKELQRQKLEMSKTGLKMGSSSYSMSSGSGSYSNAPASVVEPSFQPSVDSSRSSYQ